MSNGGLPSSACAWAITSNNPHRHYADRYEWASRLNRVIMAGEASAEEFELAASGINDMFVTGGNGRSRDPEKNGCITVFERGEEGTVHAHTLVCSQTPIKFASLQRKFNHSDIDVVRGNIQEAIDYLYKRGKYSEKAFTQLCEPVEWGRERCDNRRAGNSRKRVLDEMDAMLRDGMTPNQIYALDPEYAFYRSTIETTFVARAEGGIPNVRDLKVFYHFGDSGSGKSYTRIQLEEQYGANALYAVTGDYEHPWDQYACEPIVFLDELRPSCFKLEFLLQLMDVYRLRLPARYAPKVAAWNQLHIATILPPEDMFEGLLKGAKWSTDGESERQFYRRITEVVYHLAGKDGEYRQLSIPGEEYGARFAADKEAFADYVKGRLG